MPPSRSSSPAPSLLCMRWSTMLHVPLICISLLLSTSKAQQLPYNPTHILQNDSRLYVFKPSTDSGYGQFELGSIDLSSTLSASKLSYTTLYPSLPFLQSNSIRAFTPLLDNGGNMTVYTGDCASGAGGAQVWSFTPTSSKKNGNGTWAKESIAFDGNGKHRQAIGANFLNSGMSFSAVVGDDAFGTGAYFFGGMCPFEGIDKDWQSSANYSNLMVTLEPSQTGSKSLSYQLGTSSSRGPPIPEAGFTLTGLSPSFSNRSDGSQTQQQNFVLVGGHTSSAFINMSQVALFSLPQQGWTFVPVSQPNTERTDIAVRKDVDHVEPRSGHTAVLTSDGQHIVVFGGWIGDVDTPAEPQLAILNVGEGYGGHGPWEWTVPLTSGSGPATDSGIYGHGAAMLPGGVMMVMGGYSIPSSNSRRRRATQTASSQTLFFNISSNSWITEYSPPPKITAGSSNDGPLSKTSQKAGLGVGLGIGMSAVLSLLCFYLWYTRRSKKQREDREKQLRDLAMDAHRYDLGCLTPGIDGRGGHADAAGYFDDPNDTIFYPSAGRNNQGWRSANGHEAERTGLLVEIPSPTRGLRRSLSSRNGHHTSRYDERRVKGSGHIHPIDELEEEQEHENVPLTSRPEMAERSNNNAASVFDKVPVLDPFTDHSRSRSIENEQKLHSVPTSPTRDGITESHSHTDWQSAIGTLLGRKLSQNSNGRLSPDRSDRTESNLSDRSTRSGLSSHSTGGSVGRSVSMRSAAIVNNANHANPFRTPNPSPTSSRANHYSEGWESPTDPRTQSLTSIRSNGRPVDDKDSFTTARTSFLQLQAEGEALLGGNPDRPRPGTSSTSNASNALTYENTEPSMSRAGTVTTATSITDGPIRTRRKSWLGSVRRVLGRSISTTDSRTRSLTTSTPQLDSYKDDPASPVNPETNRMSFPAAAPPRRAASDASFWRNRRGKQDWLDEELDPNDPCTRWRRNSGDNWGAPEDVAHAEKERQRQEWRERGNLISLADDDLPTPRTPIRPSDLGAIGGLDDRPCTPADEDDWDVEAAVERRVVQVMFTVPRSKLRVVNADIERSSILSLQRENSDDSIPRGADTGSPSGSPNSRVKNIAGRFEQLTSSSSPRMTPRITPRPSPSPSIQSLKVRARGSKNSLAIKKSEVSLKSKGRLVSEDITMGER
ncbi:hypothetical protein B0J11DRAFT_529051 [Dendryphion nanum]|uniref:Galactose oxidase n=1 Tax=Dendryphion nanum TaxID=256645 RepID=A0A9P9DUM3_9PLEO|nr:hypothetical protein B0J11DRAFT_529051 [Dendryphion nanum]